MELEARLREVTADLDDRSAVLRLSESLPSRDLTAAVLYVVRAGLEIANHIASATTRRGAERGVKMLAEILRDVWTDASSPRMAGIAGWIEPGYFTVRLFLKVSGPPTASEPARASVEDAAAHVRDHIGLTAASRLNRRAVAAAARIAGQSRRLKGMDDIWTALADLPTTIDRPSPPIDRDDTAYREATAPQDTQAMPPSPEDLPFLYDVWYGTNRAPIDPRDPAKGFSNERDPSGSVHYGTCSVAIPRTHKFGSMGTPFWKRWLRLEFSDDHLTLRKIASLASIDGFLQTLRDEMGSLPQGDRSLLVYLHGYNTSFEEAALRAAQIGFDLKIPGATAFYSWPSMAQPIAYAADIARSEASEAQIADFLTAVAARAGAHRVHVIAHSMGNRGFARAIARVTSKAAASGSVMFGQVILAAPDLDVDLFKDLAAVYPKISERTTMYVSRRDKALAMSRWLQNSDRAGFTPPITILDGIDTVEVTSVDVTLLGHGYYAEAEPLLYDIKSLLDSGSPPDKRPRLAARDQKGTKYWSILA